jgi:uncharacterized membrane protein
MRAMIKSPNAYPTQSPDVSLANHQASIMLKIAGEFAALIPRRARRRMAYRAAMDQFTSRGISRKKDRSGILIFVSLAERYARIVADEATAARVPQSTWQTAVDALVAQLSYHSDISSRTKAVDRGVNSTPSRRRSLRG